MEQFVTAQARSVAGMDLGAAAAALASPLLQAEEGVEIMEQFVATQARSMVIGAALADLLDLPQVQEGIDQADLSDH